jgi:hypothetical protein
MYDKINNLISKQFSPKPFANKKNKLGEVNCLLWECYRILLTRQDAVGTEFYRIFKEVKKTFNCFEYKYVKNNSIQLEQYFVKNVNNK